MTVAIALGTRRNSASRPLRSWVRVGTVAAILIVLASIGVAMLSGQGAVAIENPQREMAALLKDCKLTLTLRPTHTLAQILPGKGGAEWYCCDLSAAECETAIESLRARVDGKNARVTANRGDGGSDAPKWWQPHKSSDLSAFEIDPPTFWIGVSKSDGKMYLRRSR
jgi:hypothetical protein